MNCYICKKEIVADKCNINISLRFLGRECNHSLRTVSFHNIFVGIGKGNANPDDVGMCGNCYLTIIGEARKTAQRLKKRLG